MHVKKVTIYMLIVTDEQSEMSIRQNFKELIPKLIDKMKIKLVYEKH